MSTQSGSACVSRSPFSARCAFPTMGAPIRCRRGSDVFPIYKAEDYRDRVPPRGTHPAVLSFRCTSARRCGSASMQHPGSRMRCKVAVGRLNAISGEPYDHRLRADPQDYIVCPDQPWLDGIKTVAGSIRQFVAMPLGLGYTVEAALTGAENFGGIQITVFEPQPGSSRDAPADPPRFWPRPADPCGAPARRNRWDSVPAVS